MSSTRLRLRRSSISLLNLTKHDVYKSSLTRSGPGIIATTASSNSILTPDLQQSTSKQPFVAGDSATCSVGIQASRIGNYLIQGEPTTTAHAASLPTFEAVNILTEEQFTCKVLPLLRYKELLAPYFRLGCHPHIVELSEVIVGASYVYAFFRRHYGDLHSYVRTMRRLRDTEAARLFGQIASVVAHCHESGVVLRDIKLRKFVFKDAAKTELMLESLDDACLLDADTDDDLLCDRHGCPAYVSPEILSASDSTYSGRAADVWSLGVVLFTMLVGRYPFHDPDPVALFRAIRHGRYLLPRHVMSEQAECLIRWILRCDPRERPAACEISRHPWFEFCRRVPQQADRYHCLCPSVDRPAATSGPTTKEHDFDRSSGKDATADQTVPDFATSFSNGSNCDFNIE